MKQYYRLVHDTARKLAIEAVRAAPEGYIVSIKPPTRSLESNAKMWAVLTEISEQVNWHGNKLTPDEWKNVFSASLKRQKVVPGLDGGFVVMGQRTSKFTKAEMNEMIELAIAFAAQHDVKINDFQRT